MIPVASLHYLDIQFQLTVTFLLLSAKVALRNILRKYNVKIDIYCIKLMHLLERKGLITMFFIWYFLRYFMMLCQVK